MKFEYGKRRGAVAFVLCVVALNSFATDWNFFGSRSIEISGTVIDVATGKPIEGVYVMAEYKEAGAVLFAHSASWCVKTKGMYTEADGKYHFPIENSHIPQVHAIKPDYR